MAQGEPVVEESTPAREAPFRGRAAERAMAAQKLQAWLLRLGLAFVMLYAAVTCLVDPDRFLTYMPDFVPGSIAETVCLPAFSAFEVVLALGLLTGCRLFAVSVLTAATMASIIVVNLDQFGVLFRNVAIAAAALSLAVHARATEERPAGVAPPTTAGTSRPLRAKRLGAKR